MNLGHRFFLSIVFLWGVSCGFAETPLAERDRTRLADGLFSRGLYDLALPEYQRLLEAVPSVGNQHVLAFRAAESARELGETELAARYYGQVLLLEKNDSTAARSRYRLAELALKQDDLKEAGKQLRAALKMELDPSLQAPVRFLLGQVLESEGRTREALQEYRTLIQSQPEDPLVGLASLRMAALGELSPEERRAAYQMALQYATTPEMKVEVHWSWASFEQKEGNDRQAADKFWDLREQYPEHSRVKQGLLQIAWAQLNAGAYNRALEVIKTAPKELRNTQADSWTYAKAVALQGLDRNEEALALYEALMEEYPESTYRPTAGFEAASLHASAGRHERVKDFEQEVRQMPERVVDGLWLLAESARATGDALRAIGLYSELLKEAPEASMAADAMFLRAVLQQEIDPSSAKQGLEEFVKHYPEDSRRFQALEVAGNLAMAESSLDEAYAFWIRALEQKDPPAELLFRTGMLAVQLEKPDDAQRWLAAGEASDLSVERKADAAYWQGILFEREGEVSSALEAYERALSLSGEAEWADRARLRLGRLYQTEDKEAEALAAFLPLAEDGSTQPLSEELLLWLVEVAEGLERPEDLLVLASAMKQPDRSPALREMGWYTQAEALQVLDQSEESVVAWQQGLAMDSGTLESVQAGLALGEELLYLERPEEALTVFVKAGLNASALEQGRLQAESLRGAGLAYQQQGNWQEAAKQFLSVSILFDDPELAPACLDLAAHAFEQAGNPQRAEAIRVERAQRYPETIPSTKETP